MDALGNSAMFDTAGDRSIESSGFVSEKNGGKSADHHQFFSFGFSIINQPAIGVFSHDSGNPEKSN